MRSMASKTFLAFLDHLFRCANALLKLKKEKNGCGRVTEDDVCLFFLLSGSDRVSECVRSV